MKKCSIVFFVVCISCLSLFVINNTKSYIKDKCWMFVELVSETPFNTKSIGEAIFRNRIRINKFYRTSN